MKHDDSGGGGGDLAGLYARWRAPLMRMLRRHFGSTAEVEDAAQEVFVRLAATPRVLGPDEEQPYLRQTMRSVVARAWHNSPAAENLQAVSFDDCHDELASIAADRHGDTEDHAAYRQRLGRLHDAVAELPARQREAFVLHRVEGHTVQETADRMGISLRMAVKHLARAVAYCEARVQHTSAAQMQRLRAAHAALAPDEDETP